MEYLMERICQAFSLLKEPELAQAFRIWYLRTVMDITVERFTFMVKTWPYRTVCLKTIMPRQVVVQSTRIIIRMISRLADAIFWLKIVTLREIMQQPPLEPSELTGIITG